MNAPARYVPPQVEIRFGDWRKAFADVDECDSLITDPPYTRRVKLGFRSGSGFKGRKTILDGTSTMSIDYEAIERDDARDLVSFATRVTRNWIVIFNDHIGWHWFADDLRAAGWYVFAPVVWLRRNAPPRFQGDGPSSQAEYIVVARPRRVTKCGHRPGYYDVPIPSNRTMKGADPFIRIGQKPLALMKQIVGHYSQPGDLVIDNFAGGGTTGQACRELGRRCLLAERDRECFDKAAHRLGVRR